MGALKYESGVIYVNGVKTKIRCFGRYVEDKPVSDNETIVLVIPGNPGVSSFYTEFAEVIHKETGHTVWILGYAGHELPNETPSLKGCEDKYGLEGQVLHKIKFIEQYVPQNAKLHIVGHSIGSYMTLKLLSSSAATKIANTYLLFPAFERLRETRNGKIIINIVSYIVWLTVFLSGIFTFFPTPLQRILVTIYMFIAGIPRDDRTLAAIIDLIDPKVLSNVFYLAYDEMEHVRERDNDVFKKNIKKIRVLYSETDGWAPKAYHDQLKSDIPDVDCHLSTYEHAFVLRQSADVGKCVAAWIKEKSSSR